MVNAFLISQFALAFTLLILGLIVVGVVATSGVGIYGSSSFCLLYLRTSWSNNQATGLDYVLRGGCGFGEVAGTIIAIAAIGFGILDFFTFKGSATAKPAATSRVVLIAAGVLTLFSWITAAIIGVGIKTFCDYIPSEYQCSDTGTIKQLYVAPSAAGLAGLFFLIYGGLELKQYRNKGVEW